MEHPGAPAETARASLGAMARSEQSTPGVPRIRRYPVIPSSVPGKVPTSLTLPKGATRTRAQRSAIPSKLTGEAPRDGTPAPDSGGAPEGLPGRLASRAPLSRPRHPAVSASRVPCQTGSRSTAPRKVESPVLCQTNALGIPPDGGSPRPRWRLESVGWADTPAHLGATLPVFLVCSDKTTSPRLTTERMCTRVPHGRQVLPVLRQDPRRLHDAE
jgi:hypothetical protein